MLKLFNKCRTYFDKSTKIHTDINYYLSPNYKIYPYFEAIRIALVYGVAGALWILLSDELLSKLVFNVDTYKKIAMYKGWAYVAITMLLIYVLIAERLTLFKKALKKIYENFEELSATNEELIALEEELKQQCDELERHRNALMLSDQRYKLAVEGTNGGIWDWDVENNLYFVSTKWKNYLGYEESELDNTLDTWGRLIHPDEKEDVVRKLENYILSRSGSYESVYRVACKDGEYKWVLSKGLAIWNAKGGAIRIAGSHTDISQQKLIENKLNTLVYHDALTELPNRLLFEIKATQLISETNRLNKKFALVYMDIDDFKNVNDTLGHASGDLLLKHISNILKEQVKAPDMAARLGGDEFAITFQNINEGEDVVHKIQDLLKYLRKPWTLNEQEFFISFSIGIAMYPDHGDNLPGLLTHSDMAMYTVKKNMKDNYSFYFPEMQEKKLKHIKMVSELRQAIDNEEFELYYQPISNLRTGLLIGAEALIRWIHPLKGLIPPMEFIPLAEETGLIYDIDKWVLKTALMQKKCWEEQGYPHIKMSINISGKRVTHHEFLDEMRQLIFETRLECDEIQIEVTETAVMTDIHASTEILNHIKDMGIKIALDDFGTGYSSLTYLQKLPIDVVKLDRGFIKQISHLEQDNVIIESVIKLTHDLDLQIVAEGIETEEQLEFLKSNGCDYGQGYLFSKPITREEMETLLSLN